MNNFYNSLIFSATKGKPAAKRKDWRDQLESNYKFKILLTISILSFSIIGGVFLWRQSHASVPLVISGKTIIVKKGGNFQTALNQARPGDTISLEAGAEFVGSFELPAKDGEQFVTIQSSALDKLPTENTRITPDAAVLMPKIIAFGKGEPAIKTAPKAHHYRFVGIEITTPLDGYTYNLVFLGGDEKKAAETPQFLEFDRCYVHSPAISKARRGFALNSSHTNIKNSYISGFAVAGEEGQGIAGWYGPGPYKIINNYVEGGAQTIFFGGGDPGIPNLVPSDIEIRGNHLSKPLAWRHKATMKYTLELKNARRVQIIGNIIENCWDCRLLGLTVRNQDGSAPWSTIEDVEIRNNLMRRGGTGINLLGTDDTNKSQRMKRVKIINNLIDDVDSVKWSDGSGGGYFLQAADTEDVEVSHNTAFKTDGNILTIYGKPSTRFVFRYNIVSYNNYGFWKESENLFADSNISDNAVVNNKGISNNDFIVPAGNYAVQFIPDLGFVDWKNGDYRLATASHYKGKSENGKDIGCDITVLNAALAGVESQASNPK